MNKDNAAVEIAERQKEKVEAVFTELYAYIFE